jgi:hypothetical protein
MISLTRTKSSLNKLDETLQEWVLNNSGLDIIADKGKVILSNQSMVRPAPPYLTMLRSGLMKIGGKDEFRNITDAIITFDNDFVAENKINLDIDGVSMTEVIFDTDQLTTMNNIIAQILADFNQVRGVSEKDRVLTLVPVDNKDILLVENVVVTEGASQANATVSSLDTFDIVGTREFTLSLQGFGGSSSEALLTNILNSLMTPKVSEFFNINNLAVVNLPSILNITTFLKTVFERRYVMDVIFNTRSCENLGTDITTIENVNMSGKGDLDGVNISVNS